LVPIYSIRKLIWIIRLLYRTLKISIFHEISILTIFGKTRFWPNFDFWPNLDFDENSFSTKFRILTKSGFWPNFVIDQISIFDETSISTKFQFLTKSGFWPKLVLDKISKFYQISNFDEICIFTNCYFKQNLDFDQIYFLKKSGFRRNFDFWRIFDQIWILINVLILAKCQFFDEKDFQRFLHRNRRQRNIIKRRFIIPRITFDINFWNAKIVSIRHLAPPSVISFNILIRNYP